MSPSLPALCPGVRIGQSFRVPTFLHPVCKSSGSIPPMENHDLVGFFFGGAPVHSG